MISLTFLPRQRPQSDRTDKQATNNKRPRAFSVPVPPRSARPVKVEYRRNDSQKYRSERPRCPRPCRTDHQRRAPDLELRKKKTEIDEKEKRCSVRSAIRTQWKKKAVSALWRSSRGSRGCRLDGPDDAVPNLGRR